MGALTYLRGLPEEGRGGVGRGEGVGRAEAHLLEGRAPPRGESSTNSWVTAQGKDTTHVLNCEKNLLDTEPEFKEPPATRAGSSFGSHPLETL